MRAKNELLRQKIKSMVEQGGYAEIAPQSEVWWRRRWVVAVIGMTLGAGIVFALLG